MGRSVSECLFFLLDGCRDQRVVFSQTSWPIVSDRVIVIQTDCSRAATSNTLHVQAANVKARIAEGIVVVEE